jgi:hypothetical protein
MSDYDNIAPDLVDVEDAMGDTWRQVMLLHEEVEALGIGAQAHGERWTCNKLLSLYRRIALVRDCLGDALQKAGQVPWR